MTKTVMDWIYLKQLYNSCGIIYVLSRKNTMKYARELSEIVWEKKFQLEKKINHFLENVIFWM